MALLPTPRTYRRYKRGCSRGDYDSESDDFGNQGQALPSTDEEGAELQRLCIKRRRSLSKGDGEEVFWLGGPKSDTISEGFGSGYQRGRDWRCWPFVSRSVMVSHPMKQSQSEARKVKSLDFSIISDSSDNSFYIAPLLHVSAQTPGNTHYEEPTVTYVLWVVYLSWGVRREYQDLLYNHKETGRFRLLSHLTYHPLSQCTERKI